MARSLIAEFVDDGERPILGLIGAEVDDKELIEGLPQTGGHDPRISFATLLTRPEGEVQGEVPDVVGNLFFVRLLIQGRYPSLLASVFGLGAIEARWSEHLLGGYRST
jgi:hypothetical protein